MDTDLVTELAPRIHTTAIRLLATHGMEVAEDGCRARVCETYGLPQDGPRVRFPEALIRETYPFGDAGAKTGLAFDTLEDSFQTRANPPGPDGYRNRAGGFALAVYDLDTRRVRPATRRDLEEALHLCHVLQIGGHYPCSATDLPPRLRNVAAHYACFTHSGCSGTHVIAGLDQARLVHAMYGVMELPMPVTLTAVTPFRVERGNLAVLRHFVENHVPAHSVRICPVAYGPSGVTYPIAPAAWMALCVAEHMGLKLVARGLRTGFEVAPGVGAAGLLPTNMQAMCLAGGHPNQVAYHVLTNALLQVLMGRPPDAQPQAEMGLYTGSPVPDAQAAAEKSMLALSAALHGTTYFGRLGNLGVDDVFSCEQLLIDLDIVSHARHAAGLCRDPAELLDMEGLEAEVAAYVEQDLSFMTADSTLRHLHSLYPPLDAGRFERRKLAAVEDPCQDRLVHAQAERKRELLKQYDYALEPAKQLALDAIYRQAERELS